MERGVVGFRVGRNTDSALVCRSCAKSESGAIDQAVKHMVIRTPSVTTPATTAEILDEHPDAKESCDVCGNALVESQ